MAEVLRPVGGVAELRAGPEDPSHVGREIDELGDRRIARALLRTCVIPRSSEPIRKASTPPAAAQRCA